ncbi:MAG: hypothetical protein Q9160_009351, partial [Pyrenula sp. 1 TL-2023]
MRKRARKPHTNEPKKKRRALNQLKTFGHVGGVDALSLTEYKGREDLSKDREIDVDPFAEPNLTQAFQELQEAEAQNERLREARSSTEEFDDGADAVEELAANNSSFDTLPDVGTSKSDDRGPGQGLQKPHQQQRVHGIEDIQLASTKRAINPFFLAHIKHALVELGFALDDGSQTFPIQGRSKQE